MISYLIYYPIYLFLLWQLKKIADEVGHRHGFLFKKIVFGKSDIDFSIFSEEELALNKIERVGRFYNRLRKLVPILGEINYFEKNGVNNLENFINIYQVKRDPLLYSKIDTKREISKEQKVIFLFRLIEGDIKNLSRSLKSRFKKLSYCTAIMSPHRPLVKKDLKNLESFKHYIGTNILDSKKDVEVINFIIEYIEKKGDISNHSNLYKVMKLSIKDKDLYEELDTNSKELYLENLKWEFWGIYTQLPFLKNKSIALVHILLYRDLIKDEYKREYDYLVERISDLV